MREALKMKQTFSLFFLWSSLLLAVNGQFLSDDLYKEARQSSVECSSPSNRRSVYQFSLKNIFENNTINLAHFSEQVLLLVNVATY